MIYETTKYGRAIEMSIEVDSLAYVLPNADSTRCKTNFGLHLLSDTIIWSI